MFNWFRRKFGKDDQNLDDKKQQTPPKDEKVVEEKSTESTPEEKTEDEYLQWAKTAYQNIQKRKTEETSKTTETEEKEEVIESSQAIETPPPIEEKEEVIKSSQTIETPPPIEEKEEVIESSQAIETPPPIEEKEEVIESSQAIETPPPIEEKEEVIKSSQTVETPPPIEEKEEVIKSSQTIETPPPIEEKEEVIKSSQTIETPPPIEEKTEESPSIPVWMKKSDRLEKLKETAVDLAPEEARQAEIEAAKIAFDEDFLWSAKVLANQGRKADEISEEEINWLKKLRQGLGKTRRSLINQLKAIVGQGPLNEDAVMEIEALLLQADVGIEATDYIIEALQNKLKEEALPPEEAIAYLKNILRDILDEPLGNMENKDFFPEKDCLNIWLMTGVNGAGKTTTIGKLTHMAKNSGYNCLIAAADTFRAAAVQQVQIWGDRTNTTVISNPGQNTDPAAVVFDGIAAAKARNTELLLVDTAGRLQNKKNLMDELAKIRRIIDKKAPNAKVESLLVLDSTLGQNGLRQAQVFSKAAKLSGVVLTKLDGTAKGGVALAVSQQLKLPIRFIGAGEGIEDLRPFSSYEFIEALLSGD